MDNTIDLVFSFDTTGSMYPCLTQVRRHVSRTVEYLFGQIPNLRIGVITHGDYCDNDKVITLLDLTNNKAAIQKFIQNAPATDGGDLDEAYELVLNRARTLNWTAGKNKALVMIGDCCPHKVGYKYGRHKNDLDWENELSLLLESGISVIPVQALGRRDSAAFYNKIAKLADSPKLDLEQFADINDIVMALCMKQAGKIVEFEKVLEKRGDVSYSVLKAVNVLAGKTIMPVRKTSKHTKFAVHPSRFQMLHVDKNCSIKDFVESNSLKFKKGRGFYEFTKTETIQDYKEVVIRDKATGEMFSGDKARDILGIPVGVTTRIKPEALTGYQGFVQSTSANRKLLGGTNFLYEVEELA